MIKIEGGICGVGQYNYSRRGGVRQYPSERYKQPQQEGCVETVVYFQMDKTVCFRGEREEG